MPDPSRTWSNPGFDVAFTNQLDQQVQYREALYNRKAAYLAAGWTVARSSNGSVADGADNWAGPGDIDIDTAGNGSWIALDAPAAFVAAGGAAHRLLATNNASADATPQIGYDRVATAPYTGGTTAALPTTAGLESGAFNGDQIIPWSTVQTGRWTSWASTRGDVLFGVKIQGTLQWRWFEIGMSFEDGDGGGKGAYRYGFFSAESASAEVLTFANLNTTTFWEIFDPGGNFNDNGEAACALRNVTAWSGGLDFEGGGNDIPIHFFSDSSSRGRWIGNLVDIFGAHPNSPAGLLDDSESAQTFRKFVFGDVFLYVPRLSLPFA